MENNKDGKVKGLLIRWMMGSNKGKMSEKILIKFVKKYLYT